MRLAFKEQILVTYMGAFCCIFSVIFFIKEWSFKMFYRDRTQPQREKALRDFRTGDACVLVSTDVCARGIDIKDLDHV